MRIHCLQHVAFENPGTIAEWAINNNHSITYSELFGAAIHFPDIDSFDWLLIMGGYMNVDEEDRFHWLKKEKVFIKEAIDAGKKVVGICLGAQLIAAALGVKVYVGPHKEIGFFPVTFSKDVLQTPLFNHFSNPYTLFHWHGDTFDLPPDAQLIASTAVCPHQAYTIGKNILALQFHLEMNEKIIEEMIRHDGHELEEKGENIQSPEIIRNGYSHLQQNKKDLFLLLDKFAFL